MLAFCSGQWESTAQHSPFDIGIKQISNTYSLANVVNIAKVEIPENTRFLWYYSPTEDPITWMLKGVGESLSFNHSKFEANGLLNLTVVYPNGVRESVFRPLRKYAELEVDAFANGILLSWNLQKYRVPLGEGDDFSFECVFRGSPINLKILLPDETECKNQFLDARVESIAIRCGHLRFRKGLYGCVGQSEEKRLESTIFLYGNAAILRNDGAWLSLTLTALTLLGRTAL